MIQKFKVRDEATGEETWEDIYGDAIRNRLRRDLNLSDVKDKEASRRNLEIFGNDNETHYHDNRYLPKIEEVKNLLNAASKNYDSEILKLKTDKANLASPTFSGSPTAPTPASGDSSNKLATTEYVTTKCNELKTMIDSIKKSIFNAQGQLVFPNGDTFWIK